MSEGKASPKVSTEELENLTYLSCRYVADWAMRKADLEAVRLLSGNPRDRAEVEARWVQNMGEYLWDHIMGEPTKPTLEQVISRVRKLTKQFWTLSLKARVSMV